MFYLLLLAVYLNQVSVMSLTFSSGFCPDVSFVVEVIALCFIFLPAFVTFPAWVSLEEMAAKTSVMYSKLFLYLHVLLLLNVKIFLDKKDWEIFNFTKSKVDNWSLQNLLPKYSEFFHELNLYILL